MSIELQITGAALAATVERNLRQQLRSTCLPTFIGASIDHLDVVPGGATVQRAGPNVDVHVPVDVFIVLDGDLAAAANGTPAGAAVPTGRATFVFRLQITLTDAADGGGSVVTTSVLQLLPTTPDLGDLAAKAALLGEDATGLAQRLVAGIPPLSVDLSAQLAKLGLTRVSNADVVLVDGVVAVRFDPPGTPAARLFSGQQWGLFVDGAGVEALLRAKLAPAQAAVPGSTLTVAWAPAGKTAHADITVGVQGSVSLALLSAVGRVEVDLPCDFSVLTGAAPALRGTVNWSVHVYLDDLPGFVEHIVEKEIADRIDPTTFGATPVGDRSFVIDTPLPAIPLLGVVLRYDSVFGSAAGMTIGGAVLIPGVVEHPFTLTVGALTGPYRLQLCSKLARAGSGNPSKDPLTPSNTRSVGSVQLTGCGKLCAIEWPPAGPSYAAFTSAQAGAVLEDATINVTLPYDVANAMTEPLTFIVRTPRGVRLVDLGMAPKAQFDANGRLLNGHDYYINDCLTFVPLGDGSSGLEWGGDIDVLKPPPLENPDWDVLLQQAGGLVVQLVRATRLEPGELLRFRSATHAIDVAADAQGRAVVPVFLPLSAALGTARLARANGRSLEGHVGVSSASFESHVNLPGRLSSGPTLTPSGNLRIAVRVGRKTAVHTVTALGLLDFRAANVGAAELNPQPLPPGPPPERLHALVERAGLRGITEVVFVPGFASSGAAVATCVDGTKLMLSVSHGDEVRITGTFNGPIGAIDIAGPWAVSSTRHETSVLRFSAPQRLPQSTDHAEPA